MARRLFLSYSHLDHDFAERIRRALRTIPLVEVWKDTRALVPGREWEGPLWSSLDASDAVVALISTNYLNSDWCKAEAEQAKANGTLLPVLLEPCAWKTLGISDLHLVQAEDPRLTLIDVWDRPADLARWLDQVREAIERGLTALGADAGLLPLLREIGGERLSDALMLAGVRPDADPTAQVHRLVHADPGHPVVAKLARLGHVLPVAPSGPPAGRRAERPGEPRPTPPPPPPTAPDPWAKYWQDRLDRVEVWVPLAGAVSEARRGDDDQAYLIVGAPNQQPEGLVSRMRKFLPAEAPGEASPNVVVVPFPDPDFVATTGPEVERLVVAHLMDHPSFLGFRPDQGAHLLVRQAAEARPLVIVLGPLRESARRQERGLVEFLGSLRALFGAPSAGRWPVRLVAVVEEADGAGLYSPVLRALAGGRVHLVDFPPLHFPSWEEVYGQLGADARFAGLGPAQITYARLAYREAVVAKDVTLYELVTRLLAILERAKEQR